MNDSKLVNKNRWVHFTQIPNEFIYCPNISIDAKMMFIYLLSFDYSGEGIAFPSKTRIMRELNMGDTKYNRIMTELKELKLITVTQEKGENGRFAHNVYILENIFEKIDEINSTAMRFYEPGEPEPRSSEPGYHTPNNTNNINNTNIYNNTNNIKKDISNNNEEEIFEYWNTKGLVKHKKINKNIQEAISKALKEYDIDDILDAIDNYEEVVHDQTYFFDTIWPLDKFLKQQNALPEFLNEGAKWLSYANRKNGGVKGSFHSNGESNIKFNTSNRRK